MITGSFTKVEIPAMVKPGATIPLRVAYVASNPGANYWSTCIMAKVGIGGAETMKIVSTTRELGQEGGGEHTYNLGSMPNERITIQLRLLGHDEAGHQWVLTDWRN